MKARRQMKILEIVREQVVGTQEELARHLREQGIEVTQATVSRDIKELQLLKLPNGDGRYRYAMPPDQPSGVQAERMRRVFRECVVGIDWSENLVVVKALSGTGSAIGEAVDCLRWPEVVGTVAGDNTVLVVVRKREASPRLVEKLRALMG
ncbi:MAG: arginine repressor [Acetobacteraceae bacterium]|nr:arginine repressor [Acetobacteraceae bacterium]